MCETKPTEPTDPDTAPAQTLVHMVTFDKLNGVPEATINVCTWGPRSLWRRGHGVYHCAQSTVRCQLLHTPENTTIRICDPTE
mmetsp:Transcript_20451/g.46738  ORF Transcript_20451/g.46738 Transcript_20451/m.46738 type:complete len:83 (-) Transcript_20451:366-614(-)